jgi:hypothetical protein
MLLSDPSSSIDVRSQRTRARGALRGEDSDERYGAEVEDFDKLRDVKPGDVLITSGIATRFPPGLLVGTVIETSAPDDSLYLRAKVRPAARLDTLEYVLVLVHRDPPRGPRLGHEPDEEELQPLADAGPVPARFGGRTVAKVADAGPAPLDGGPPALDAGTAAAAVDGGVTGVGAPAADAGVVASPPAHADAGAPVTAKPDAGTP